MRRTLGCMGCWLRLAGRSETIQRRTYSVPLRLNSQATSSSIATTVSEYHEKAMETTVQMTNPAFFCFSSSLRRSLIFSWNVLPANSSGWTVTSSLGRGGRSLAQTRSTRFCSTPTSGDPFFLRVSVSLRAPAALYEPRPQVVLEQV